MLLGVGAAYGVFTVVTARLSWKPPRLCPVYRLTGRDCPLCGLTTALGLCSRGRFQEAITNYPRALATGAAGALLTVVLLGRQRAGRV